MSALGPECYLMLVPNDPEKPVVGPFMLVHGKSWENNLQLASELGYREGEYTFRPWVNLDDLLNDGDATPRPPRQL